MSSSPPGSPTPRRYKSRSHRVSFDMGLTNPSKVPGFFTQLAAATANTLPVQQKSTASSRHSHHLGGHSGGHRHGASHMDRRARVDDVDDEDDDANYRARSSRARAATASSSSGSAAATGMPLGGPVLDPSLQTTTASAAAGFPENAPAGVGGAPGFNGMNPAAGANHIFTHLNNGLPQQPYNIQAFPTLLPSTNMAVPGYPFGVGTTHAVNGVDPTAVTGLSFLPAVPDATNGPMIHTYVPRHDGPGQNIVYIQQPNGQQQAMYTTANGVPIQIATTTAPIMAYPQTGMGQPMYVQQQPGMAYAVGAGGIGGIGGSGTPVVMMSGGVPGGNYIVGGGGGGLGSGGGFGGVGGVHPEPAMGIGQTPNEVLQEQLEFAYANNLYEPQDFKPADDDKSRFYWLRELDGNWTQRSRATIDHLGCRWYITDGGVFYAVRLPD
ncbi:hypothetical protein SPBR_05857 [Sporothrix brasiliensis 5110]|uniref:Uncharacterized protein n=1 Tax=Sporothrix brasiliensis 5110 TaxID=1398154 RepID=A0A0C2IYK1_9PEZI|nr:uncharacterized protein SPBR_05857 [Sporothrix brasiliensis 5110]KIH94126.1 hypothetical protein SPBR_05857 [Sporothrix brasiliensis 5110]